MAFKKLNPDVLVSTIIGLIFISEGIQKLLFPEAVGVGRFIKNNVPFAETTVIIVAIAEIVFGAQLALRIKIKFAVIPLLAVITGALIFTKYPILVKEGFWKAAHEARTDLLMLTGLLFLAIKNFSKKIV